jgi:copper chaperone
MTVTTVVRVMGMTCGHCETAVRQEVGQVPGVTDVAIDLASGEVTVTSQTELDQEAFARLAAAVDEAGYVLAT